MIKKIALIAAAVSGLVLSSAGWAVADAGGHSGGHKANPGIVCAVGGDSKFSNICGNTDTKIFNFSPNIWGSEIYLYGPPPLVIGVPDGGGSGGNN